MSDFTQDWTSPHVETWTKLLSGFAGCPGINALEIGSYEGRSACWFAEHVLTGSGANLDCVDTWLESAETEARFVFNTRRHAAVVRKHKSDSFSWLLKRHQKMAEESYHFIYIDGCHDADKVLGDLTLAWPLLRSGGVLICDDYSFSDPTTNLTPRLAVDGFFACRDDWTLLDSGGQYIVRKLASSRSDASSDVVNVEIEQDTETTAVHPANGGPYRGVLTAASKHYWLTLRLQVLAARQAGVAVAVADHGLHESQRAWLIDHQVTLLETTLSETRQRAETPDDDTVNLDNAWLKPAICRASPFEETVWIDADAVPIRGLDAMFQALQAGSWLTMETYVSPLHARQCYLKVVRLLAGQLPPQYPHASQINSGVFAFHRGDRWIDQWADLCDQITSDSDLVRSCGLRDQHALVALLCRQGSDAKMPRVLEDRGFNWAANGLQVEDSKFRKRYRWDSQGCLDELREDHPNVSVVHWLGGPKPWAMG